MAYIDLLIYLFLTINKETESQLDPLPRKLLNMWNQKLQLMGAKPYQILILIS
jgi:hypothetical protein